MKKVLFSLSCAMLLLGACGNQEDKTAETEQTVAEITALEDAAEEMEETQEKIEETTEELDSLLENL